MAKAPDDVRKLLKQHKYGFPFMPAFANKWALMNYIRSTRKPRQH